MSDDTFAESEGVK